MRSSLIGSISAGCLHITASAGAAAPADTSSAAALHGSRTGAEMEGANGLRGTLLILGIVVVLALIGALVVFDDDEDAPSSP